MSDCVWLPFRRTTCYSRQADNHTSSLTLPAFHLQGPAMLLNDGVDCDQAQAIAMTGALRREERFEEVRLCLGVHAKPGVGYGELNAGSAMQS